jgi:hypothetical protein
MSDQVQDLPPESVPGGPVNADAEIIPEAAVRSAFVCDCEERMRSACAGNYCFGVHEGKKYCVLHFPGKEKREEFYEAAKRKLDSVDFNFKGVWFPEVSFVGFTFSADAFFSCTTFRAEALFNTATFTGKAYFIFAASDADADFNSATFGAWVNFNSAIFGKRIWLII